MQVYREELIHKGAISVEFRVAPIGPAPEIGSINNYSQLNDIIESYEKELDTRVKVVGRTIREGNYEALKYKH